MPAPADSLFQRAGWDLLGRYNDLGRGRQSRSNPYVARRLVDGALFYLKSADTAPFAYVFANEVVCASLADLVEIPQAEHAIVRLEGSGMGPFFGSRHLEDSVVLADLPPDELESEVFRADYARMCAFDLWVMNRDRHDGNFLLVPKLFGVDPNGELATVKRVHVFDHDCALFNHGIDHNRLLNKNGMPEGTCVERTVDVCSEYDLRIPASEVNDAVSAIQAVPDADLITCIRGAKADLGGYDLDLLSKILVTRKTQLGDISARFLQDVEVRAFFPSSL